MDPIAHTFAGAALAAFEILLRCIRYVWPAMLGALVFALHPVQVESVGWIAGTKDVLAGMLALVALSACVNETGQRPSAADRHPSGSAAPCVPPAPGTPSPASGPRAPDLALACFAGGGEVRLTTLGRPAIVNLWATWCEACYDELPALNEYAKRSGVLVLTGAAGQFCAGGDLSGAAPRSNVADGGDQ